MAQRAEDERDRIKGVYFAVADNRTLIYDYLVRLSISIPSEDSGSYFIDSLVTRVVTVVKKMINGFLAEET